MIEWILEGLNPGGGREEGKPGGRSLSYLQVGGDCTRAVEFHQRWGQGPAALLVLEWEERNGICHGFS